jgi:hypothetical protein
MAGDTSGFRSGISQYAEIPLIRKMRCMPSLTSSVTVDEGSFRIFSLWIEVPPMDQMAALEYKADEHL